MAIHVQPYDLRYENERGVVLQFGLIPGIVISQIRSLTSIPVNIRLSQGFRQVGGVVQGRSVQHKDLLIQGEIAGTVDDGVINQRKLLLDAIVPEVRGKLIYNDKWELDVETLETPDIGNHRFHPRYQFTLRAPYPYWLAPSLERTPLSAMIARFRYKVNYKTPHIFGRRIRNLSVNVPNEGNVPANFRVTFFARTALSNPQLMNVRTGEIIRINRNMIAGELIEVDMTTSPLTVTSTVRGETSNIFGNLDRRSYPFKIEVGDNVLQDTAEANPSGLDCFVNFRMAYTGPW